MLKRIRRHQIRGGMFVADLEDSGSPKRARPCNFLVKNDADLLTVKSSKVISVVIDTLKGLDVDGTTAASTAEDRAPALHLRGFSDDDRKGAMQTIERTRGLLESLFSDIRLSGVANYEHANLAVEQVARSMENNPAALIGITRLKSKDEYSFLHSISVCALMVHFGRFLGRDEEAVRLLGVCGLLHDIGKLVMPDAILAKTGPLTEEEMAQIRLHPVRGHEILKSQCDLPPTVLDVCLHHHERMDGKGYPYGLTDKQLSLESRVAAICDVYDAMTSLRPYKRALAPAETLKMMWSTDGHFDPHLLRQFTDSLRWKGKSKRTEERCAAHSLVASV